MIIETVQFNPSICTCEEHGCQPQYRMEKRVLWTNQEACHTNKQPKVNDREMEYGYRESKFEERITKQDRKIGNFIESKQMGLKEENDKEFSLMIEGDGNKCESAGSVKERMSGNVEVRSGAKANYALKEKEKVELGGDDDNDDEKEEEKKEENKNEVWYRDSKDDICNAEEANYTNNTKKNNSYGRSERDNSEGKNSEIVYGEKNIGNDSESAFNNDCKWGGKCSKVDQIDENQTTREGDGAVDRDGAGNDEDCSENRILINNADETAESCSLESKEEDLEDVEIASAFGILSIYCNSELHSWVSFEVEDASKKIH